MTDSENWSLKRLAWAYGCAKTGSEEETIACARLVRKLRTVPLWDPDDVEPGQVRVDLDAKQVYLGVRLTENCLLSYLREIYVDGSLPSDAEFPFEHEKLREGWSVVRNTGGNDGD